MKTERGKVRLNWFWGCIGFCGILGFIFKEPLYYVFFVFFLFFLEPALKISLVFLVKYVIAIKHIWTCHYTDITPTN